MVVVKGHDSETHVAVKCHAKGHITTACGFDIMSPTISKNGQRPSCVVCQSHTSCDKCGETHLVKKLEVPDIGSVFLCQDCWDVEMKYRETTNLPLYDWEVARWSS